MYMGKVPINIVFIGHVDSGKSTAAGHLICKLGGLEKDVIERVEKEAAEMNKPSFKYAWVLDRLKTERERGITIDISLSKFETIKYKCTVIDTPGHKDYIMNMMAGASQADCAVLIIDSTTGFEASVNDPTCEHALLAFTLGVNQIICCCNKMDATTPKYSFVRYSQIMKQVLPFLSSVGYNPYEIPFVPISSLDGDNLIERSTKFDWYNGPTLFQAIDIMKEPKRPLDKPLRLPIQGVYNIGGIGVMPVGRVETGCLRPGMLVNFTPSGLQAKVNSLVMHPGIFSTRLQAEANSLEMHHKTLHAAYPGDIVGFKVDDPDMDIKQGDVASDPENDPAIEAAHFTSHVIITNHPCQIENGYEATLHCHNFHTTVKFEELIYKVDSHSGEVIEKWPPLLVSGDAGVIKMIPSKPLVVEPFSLYPPLGRFVVRDLGQTVAVGVVCYVTCKISESALKKN